MRILTQRKTAKKRSRSRHAINSERVKMRITKGDTVRVMRGSDRDKEGTVLRVYPKTGEPTRIRMRIDTDGTKERIGVKGGQAIPRER